LLWHNHCYFISLKAEIFEMKILKLTYLTLSILVLTIQSYSQQSSTPEQTAEQEAVKQTEKLQVELKLSAQQAKLVHNINLKYARERLNSNSRSEAIQRIKKKYDELKLVLNIDQYSRLLNKQYERSLFQSSESNKANSPSIRSENIQQFNGSSKTHIKSNTSEVQTFSNEKHTRDEDTRNKIQ